MADQLVVRLLRRLESRALLILFAAAGAIWAFLAVGDEMGEGGTLALDKKILLAFRTPGNPSDPIGSRSFEEAMRDVTALGGTTVLTLVTAVATIAFLIHRKVRHAAVLVATVLIAEIASEQLKGLYGRPRPDLVPHGAYVYSASFPSGHSMIAATVYLTLAALISNLERKPSTRALVFATAIGLMAAIGVSRVYLGVHWPSDVLAGWCAGSAVALIAWSVLRRVAKTRDGVVKSS
jgi:undecaprenyl-diphosphatase